MCILSQSKDDNSNSCPASRLCICKFKSVWSGYGGFLLDPNNTMITLGTTIPTTKNVSRSISSLFFIACLHFMTVDVTIGNSGKVDHIHFLEKIR
jgi:hypothetical protein